MAYDQENLFAKILRGEIPCDTVYEDQHCLAFRDINPQAPTHILVIPRKPIAKLADAEEEDRETLGHLIWAAKQVAADDGLEDNFRLVINCGEKAGQSVFHLHVHVLGGRPFTWPPG